MAAPSNDDFILPVNTVDGVPVAHAFNQTPSSGDYCIPVAGSDGVPVMRKVVSADATDDLCAPAIAADGVPVLMKSGAVLKWVPADCCYIERDATEAVLDRILFSADSVNGVTAEGYINLKSNNVNCLSGNVFAFKGYLISPHAYSVLSNLTVLYNGNAVDYGNYFYSIQFYAITNKVDFTTLTWANRPIGTAIYSSGVDVRQHMSDLEGVTMSTHLTGEGMFIIYTTPTLNTKAIRITIENIHISASPTNTITSWYINNSWAELCEATEI